MKIFKNLAALGKIADVFRFLINLFFANKKARTDEKSNAARDTVSSGDDARRLRRERFNKRMDK